MFMVVDTMAQKYGMLPMQVLEQANTADMQIHIAVEQHRAKMNDPDYDKTQDYTQEELQEIWQKSKS
tara:strand:+ start:513 stop:713 length:201 start_codon:yes stop_codon:yes gene_type:complete